MFSLDHKRHTERVISGVGVPLPTPSVWLSLDRIALRFLLQPSSKCLHHISAAILVHIWCAPTWRFHTELCKFLWIISTNICGLGKRTDVKLGQVSCLFISDKVTISWLYPLNGFRFIFLLRDSENDLFQLSWFGFLFVLFQSKNVLLPLRENSDADWQN